MGPSEKCGAGKNVGTLLWLASLGWSGGRWLLSGCPPLVGRPSPGHQRQPAPGISYLGQKCLNAHTVSPGVRGLQPRVTTWAVLQASVVIDAVASGGWPEMPAWVLSGCRHGGASRARVGLGYQVHRVWWCYAGCMIASAIII
jgi:hypothetical protein